MAEPKTEEQLDELLNDPEKLDARIAAQVEEKLGSAVKEQLAQALRANAKEEPPKRIPMIDPSAEAEVKEVAPGQYVRADYDPWRKMGFGLMKAQKTLYSKRAPGSSLDGQYEDFGSFLTTVHNGTFREVADARLKVLTEGSGADGGFLVPEEFRSEMLRLAIEEAVVRSRARVIPMARETMLFPAIKDTSHASSIHGGVQAFWNPESADLSADSSQPAFVQVRYTAHKLTGYTLASNDLLADSAITLEALLMEMFSDALAYFEDIAFIEGTGSGQPEGILTADSLITVSKETGQAAATIVTENLDKMFMRMLPASRGTAVWLAHYDIMPQLLALSRTVGTGGAPVMMMNIQGAPVFIIYGRPVIFTEKAQTLGTKGDIYFADFSYYIIGDRQALSIAASPHVKFINDETVWRFIQRLDGKSWLTSALTPRNGTTTISPFVALADRT